MSALDTVERSEVELVDDAAQFFAPVASDLVDQLIGQYQHQRRLIAELAAYVAGAQGGVLHYFLDGNSDPDRGRGALSNMTRQLFEESGAVGALNSAYWSKALALTDVLDMMPQKRRDEWNKSIREQKTPDFEETTVRTTLQELLAMRSQFLAERVDGIFRELSGSHVTNVPEGFGRRMIIARMLTSYDTVESSRAGYINDLRAVIAKFMGRDEPRWHSTDRLISIARAQRGEWLNIDGGAMRMRVYKVGTAHLEVHPDMSYRLNMVLAQLHPLAIPAQFRMKPKKPSKAFQMMGRPLPFSVIGLLASMRIVYDRSKDLTGRGGAPEVRNARAFDFGDHDAAARAAAEDVLRAIGGTPDKLGKGYHFWQFDYEPREVLNQIIASGCLPDQKAHQFYPTNAKLAKIAVDLADIGPTDECAEPSAGQGGIADHLPKDRTTCIEISPLHCAVLRAKGFATIEADFLTYAGELVDVVVMNPPFSEGRAKLHTEHAATMIKPGGRLVAILPASAKGKDWLGANWQSSWTSVYEGEFAGTSVAVVILKAVRVS